MQQLLQYTRNSAKRVGRFNPIVITDIDGVLLRGTVQIPGTLDALKRLKAEQVPFACLTNGGGQLEELKVKKMNDIFG